MDSSENNAIHAGYNHENETLAWTMLTRVTVSLHIIIAHDTHVNVNGIHPTSKHTISPNETRQPKIEACAGRDGEAATSINLPQHQVPPPPHFLRRDLST